MKRENAKKAVKIINRIEELNDSLEKAQWAISDSVSARYSYWSFDGDKGSVEIPESMFKAIGKLVITELQIEIAKLEDQWKEL